MTSDRKISFKQINERITKLLQQSIKSEGIINIIDIEEEISLFDSKFLDNVSKINEPNLRIKLLENLLNDQVKVYKRKNLVKSKEFSEMMKRTMNNYINGHITNEEKWLNQLKNLMK